MTRWPALLLSHPWKVLAILALLGAAFGASALRLESDASTRSFLRDHDPAYALYLQYKEVFDQEEMLVIAFEDREIFTPENLALIRRLTRKLESVDHVRDVRSLSNVEYLRGSEDSFQAEPLVPESGADLAEARRISLANPLIFRDLISPGARQTALLVTFKSLGPEYSYEKELGQVERIVAEEARESGKEFHLAGERYLDRRFLRYIHQDLGCFLPLTFLLLGLLLYLALRTWRETFIGLATTGACLAVLCGSMPLLGWKMDSVTSGLPSLILCIVVLNVLHILHRYRTMRKGLPDSRQALVNVLREVSGPILMCNLTTAIGFATNLLTDVRPIRGFSLLAALGIGACAAISLAAVPCLLLVWKDRSPAAKIPGSLVSSGTMWAWADFMHGHRRLVVGGYLVLLGGACLGIPYLSIQSDRTEYLRPSSDVYQALRFIEAHLAGTNPLDIWIEGGANDALKNPELLGRIEALSTFLRAQPEVDKVISMNDFLKEMNQAFHEDRREYYVLPRTREQIAQFLLIYSLSGQKNELNKYLDPFARRTRLSVRTSEHNSARLEALASRIQKHLEVHFPAPLSAHLASVVLAQNNVFHTLVGGLFLSLAASILMVGAIVCLGFRSLYAGLVCMLPNVTPVLAALGLMGWCGIHLDIATAMTFSIALGLTVDDTIHFMSVYRQELERRKDERLALRATLDAVGSAVIEAGVIIIAGFLILLFASLRMNATFGLLCAFIMLLAVVTDLAITPLCMLLFHPFGRPGGKPVGLAPRALKPSEAGLPAR